MEITFLKRHVEAPSIISYFFAPPTGFSWTPGDYTELSLVYPEGGDRRWLSIASVPEERSLQFTVKLPPQPSRFKQRLDDLKPGDTAHISPPMGSFNLPRRPEPLLFVAGGIGITPYRALLKAMRNEPWDVSLVYTTLNQAHVFKEVIAESPAVAHFHDSGKQTLSLRELQQLVSDWHKRIIYLAGPQAFAESLMAELAAAGYDNRRLKLDYFPGYDLL